MVVGLPTRMTYLDDHVPRYWCVSNALLFNSTAQCLLHFGYRHEGDIGGVVCLIVQLLMGLFLVMHYTSYVRFASDSV